MPYNKDKQNNVAIKAEISATTIATTINTIIQVVVFTGAPPYLVFIVQYNKSILLY